MDCLVTQLKGEINNSNLLVLGKSRVNLSNNSNNYAGFTVKVNVSKVVLENVLGDLYYFSGSDYTKLIPVDGKITFPSTSQIVYVKGGESTQFDVQTTNILRFVGGNDILCKFNNTNALDNAVDEITTLETLSFASAQYIEGSVESLVEKQWSYGRRSGSIYLEIPSNNIGNITFNNISIAGTAHSIVFDTDSVTVKIPSSQTVKGTYNGTTWTYV